MSNKLKIGDWIRLPDYQVGSVVCILHDEVMVVTTHGRVMSASDVQPIPNPISPPRTYTWPAPIAIPRGMSVMTAGKWSSI